MRVTAAGGKKGFDPSKVITKVTIAEKSVTPDVQGNNPYQELYDTLKTKPSADSQRSSDNPSDRGPSLASVARVPFNVPAHEPSRKSEEDNGYQALYERSQSKKRSKNEIFFGIWGLLVIIFVLIKAFRWFMA
jgi:hypothetical protein